MSGHELLAEIVRETTQVEFAKRVGCSPALINQYVQGKMPISLRMARRFGEATGHPVAKFLDLEAA